MTVNMATMLTVAAGPRVRRRGVPASTIGRTGQEVGLDGQPHDTHHRMAAKKAIPSLEPDQLYDRQRRDWPELWAIP